MHARAEILWNACASYTPGCDVSWSLPLGVVRQTVVVPFVADECVWEIACPIYLRALSFVEVHVAFGRCPNVLGELLSLFGASQKYLLRS